ncbi:helical backbone metal receptor [Gonapodya prolifera JEL478]|uniref:Helical backbone metal receptor n=1 Tax=Gonapodya prolifera (strain JEL478) TaxID=1344416 RepID=A0A139ACP9_GONPJ|nr:helical backbone metal receptor [Gonapodya prolifera JEL478]|eukprot:KXS14596.1 helical backbone metal receptor [Gonapodya prolifera JEL478]
MPPRVISLLPSATELLCILPTGPSLLVARSHECDYPKSITHLPIVTGQLTTFTTSADVDRQVSEALSQGKALYTIDEKVIRELKPDVIITQSLCNVCAIDLATVHRLAKTLTPRPKVVTLNPNSIEDVLNDITTVGEAVGLVSEAAIIRSRLEERVERAAAQGAKFAAEAGRSPRVAFLEWPDPIYPGGHWTAQLIHLAGGTHPVHPPFTLVPRPSPAGPSTRVTPEQVLATDPEIYVGCFCGLNMEATRKEMVQMEERAWWKTAMEKNPRVVLVDGNEMFNRPGPRLVDALEFLVGYFWKRSEIIPSTFPLEKYVRVGAGKE